MTTNDHNVDSSATKLPENNFQSISQKKYVAWFPVFVSNVLSKIEVFWKKLGACFQVPKSINYFNGEKGKVTAH